MNDKVESFWVRIRRSANKVDILVGGCYRLPNQDEEKDKAFYEQAAEVAQSPALILMADFNFPDRRWKYNTVQRKQSKRFLECVEDSFLTQLVQEPTRGGVLLDLLFTNREGLVAGVKA